MNKELEYTNLFLITSLNRIHMPLQGKEERFFKLQYHIV